MVWIKLAGWDRKINIKKETLEESIKICALNCRKFPKCKDRWICISGVIEGMWSFEICRATRKLEEKGLIKIER